MAEKKLNYFEQMMSDPELAAQYKRVDDFLTESIKARTALEIEVFCALEVYGDQFDLFTVVEDWVSRQPQFQDITNPNVFFQCTGHHDAEIDELFPVLKNMSLINTTFDEECFFEFTDSEELRNALSEAVKEKGFSLVKFFADWIYAHDIDYTEGLYDKVYALTQKHSDELIEWYKDELKSLTEAISVSLLDACDVKLDSVESDESSETEEEKQEIFIYDLQRKFMKILARVDFHTANVRVQMVKGVPVIKGRIVIWDDFCEQTGYLREELMGLYKKYVMGYDLKFR